MDPEILRQVDELRNQIRRYVWIEGIAIAILWLCLTFWIGLAIDYLPVRMGSSEMPRGARAVLLAIISAMLMFILYRYVWRRVHARLQPANLAVLIERVFPEFRDSLVTAIEMNADRTQSAIEKQLLTTTKQEAANRVRQIDVRRVLDYRPLIRACAGASVSLVSVVLFAILATGAFSIWVQRLYGLSNAPYPRRTAIEAIGFVDHSMTVARGSDFRLHVRAEADRPTPPPNVCTIFFRTEQGHRGRANLSKQGAVRDGFQYYTYEEKPFRNILSDVEFDVVGGDFRLTDYHVHVVESPQIVGIQLKYKLPEYTGLLPREESYFSGIQLVRGTAIELTLTTNKPIQEAVVRDGQQEIIRRAVNGSQAFQYSIETLTIGVTHEISLVDTDGIASIRPYRLTLGAFQDQVPRVDARLVAISSAVTTDARIPIVGEASDDFGIQSLWIGLASAAATRNIPASITGDGKLDMAVDLRELRRLKEDPFELAIGSKLHLSANAKDFSDIDDQQQIGKSDPYELEVVTPGQLLAMLEAREVGLQWRLKQTISEVRETRDSVAHVRSSDLPTTAPVELGQAEAVTDPARERSLNLLRVQRARQHGERASQEVLGVALSFEDIRNELINNRVDSAEHQQRIERDISTPLKHVAEFMFPELSETLRQLEEDFNNDQSIDRWTTEAVRQLDEILLAMEAVRDKMLDLESYNELVDQMRSLIQDQDTLIEKTKKRRKQSALDLLREN